MIHLPVHRTKGCAALGATAPGLPGPFGVWSWEPDEDDSDTHAEPAAQAASEPT